jgi:hypothetical protein
MPQTLQPLGAALSIAVAALWTASVIVGGAYFGSRPKPV